MADVLDPALGALDALRGAALRAATSWTPARDVLRSRDRRVAWQACLGATVAACATVLAPAWLYVLGPIVLGVPHVVSDLRYLLLRRAPERAWLWICAASSVVLVGLRVAVEVSPARGVAPAIELALGGVWVALGIALASRGRWNLPRIAACVLALALGAAAATRPTGTALALVHAHNLVAVAVWAGIFRRRPRAALVPIAWVLVAAGLVSSASAVAWSLRHGAASCLGAHILTAADAVSPALPGDLAVRLAYAYVFLQSVHYAAWLAWIPQEDIRAEGTLTFRGSWRALRRDLGAAGLVCALLAAASVALAAVAAVHRARATYLSLASVHVYFELACVAYLVARGAPQARRSPR